MERPVSLQSRMLMRILPVFFLVAGALVLAFVLLGSRIRENIMARVEDETVRSVSEFLGEYGETLALLEAQYTLAMNSMLDSIPRVFAADTSALDIPSEEREFFARQHAARLWNTLPSQEKGIYTVVLNAAGAVVSSTLPRELPPVPPTEEAFLRSLAPAGRLVLPLFWNVPLGRYFLYGYVSFPDGSRMGICLEIPQALPEKILGMVWRIRNAPFVDGVGLYDPVDGRPVGRHSPALSPALRQHFRTLTEGVVFPVTEPHAGAVRSALFLWSPPAGTRSPLGLGQVGVLLRLDFSFLFSAGKGLLLGGLAFLALGIVLVAGSIVRASREVVAPFRQLGIQMRRFMSDQGDFSGDAFGEQGSKIEEIRELGQAFLSMAREIVAGMEQLRAANEEMGSLYRRQEVLALRMERVFSLAAEITEAPGQDAEAFLERTLNVALELVPEADAGTVGVIEDDRWRFVASVGHDGEALRAIPLRARDVIPLEGRSVLVRQPLERFREHLEGPVFQALRQATSPVREALVIPLRYTGKLIGHLALDITASRNAAFSVESIRVMEAFGNLAAAFLSLKRLFSIQGRFQREIAMSMISILEQYDAYTKGHSENVALLARRLAERMDLGEEASREVYWAGLVHDIGKLLVPIDILNKPSRLTEAEFEIVKSHPLRGERVLARSEDLARLGAVVGSHHERWDGKGYPAGLQGEAIPLLARILAVVDAYDAMTSDRSYRRGLGVAIALDEIRRCAGSQFDPLVVKHFVEMMTVDPVRLGASADGTVRERTMPVVGAAWGVGH